MLKTNELEKFKNKIATKILTLSSNKLNDKLLIKLDGYLDALTDVEEEEYSQVHH
ncbi:MAG: hypothetical protein KIC92_09560 [Clostridiales bacterium]|nr:hypothetical protein [Clostridiales bacterium]